MTLYSDSKKKGDNIADNDQIRYIPILPTLTSILLEIVQTQDIFHIEFQPEFNECDISVYEFRNYLDIRREVLQKSIRLQISSWTDTLFPFEYRQTIRRDR